MKVALSIESSDLETLVRACKTEAEENLSCIRLFYESGDFDSSEARECASRVEALLRIMDASLVAHFSVLGKEDKNYEN